MADEPDADRLRALEARLDRAAGKSGKPDGAAAGKGFSQGEQAWRMIIELVAGLVIGMGIGYGLDRLFGTLPVCLILFTLLGFAAGIKTMLRTAAEMQKNVVPGQPGPDERGG